ncbi:MAG: SDR family oxidoreductase, partial [Flavobacteriaceae bacterium]|nr:SDR family oxidoreductase [Flavobacteriaceae bacterium]
MKKILITGSNGLLGQNLVNLLLKEKDTYEVVGVSRGANRSERKDFAYYDVDITHKEHLRNLILEVQPNVIVNTAAMTNVDACEAEKENCLKLNVTAVQYLVDLALEVNAHLIHISTDFIFDGKNGPYKETDSPNPLNYYGKTKLLSEEVLTNSTIDTTILRTILVYGLVANM